MHAVLKLMRGLRSIACTVAAGGRGFLLFFLLAVLPAKPLGAQQATIDSIRAEIAHLNPNDPHYLADRAGAIGTLLQSLKYAHPEQSLLLCDTLYAVFMELHDTVKALEAKYRYKAGIYDLRGEYDSMLLNLEAYAEALASINRSDGYVYIDIGNVYFGFSMFGLATVNYNRAEEIFLKEKNLRGLCTIYNNHAQMNMQDSSTADSALMWLRKSYYVRAHQLKDPVLSHESLYLMAIVYRRSEQYDSAKTLLWQVIADIRNGEVDKHTDHIALRQEFSGAYTAMGSIYSAENNHDSAEYYFREGEKLYRESGYNNRLSGLYNSWCRLYMKEHDVVRSREYLKKCEAFSSLSKPSDAMSLYQLYADWYEWQGQDAEMYRYRMMYYRISDSLQSSGNREQTMVVASRVLQLQDKAHIEQQKAEIAEQNIVAEQAGRDRVHLMIIVMALFLVVLMAGWGVYQLRKKNALIGKYNRELEAANSTKEQFLSVISHDLRSPFNSLIGMSDLLRQNAKAKNFANVEQNAGQINEASRKAFVLLDNLMQWVSVQKETITVKKEPVSANEVIDEVLFLLSEQALGRNMTIEKDICVAKLVTDKTLLQVVLRNLLSNAVKYTPPGGRILVRCVPEGPDVHLIVEDNGTGFPQGDLEVMMHTEQNISVAKKGGGLGLVLVRQFVLLLGGTIRAENMHNSGARVTVTLPGAGSGEIYSAPKTAVRYDTALSPGEKQMLSSVVQSLSRYELFDATEIRELIEKPIEGETQNVTEWRKNLLQSVYLADENKYAELINSAMQDAGI